MAKDKKYRVIVSVDYEFKVSENNAEQAGNSAIDEMIEMFDKEYNAYLDGEDCTVKLVDLIEDDKPDDSEDTEED